MKFIGGVLLFTFLAYFLVAINYFLIRHPCVNSVAVYSYLPEVINFEKIEGLCK